MFRCMINRARLISAIFQRNLQTRPVLEVSPSALNDRARAIMKSAEDHRSLLKKEHEAFLSQLKRLFPELADRKTKTNSSEEEADYLTFDLEFMNCLKGIAKRMVGSKSRASTGNIFMLLSIADSPKKIKLALEVLKAQRWHLASVHEVVSAKFSTKVIDTWPIDQENWSDEILDIFKSATSNCSISLTPSVLIKTLSTIKSRMSHRQNDMAHAWSWFTLALRLFQSASSQNESIYSSVPVSAAYIDLIGQIAREARESPEFKIPNTEISAGQFAKDALKTISSPSILAAADKFSVAHVLKLWVDAEEAFPTDLEAYINSEKSYLAYFNAFKDGKVDGTALEAIEVEKDGQGYHYNMLTFLRSKLPQPA